MTAFNLTEHKNHAATLQAFTTLHKCDIGLLYLQHGGSNYCWQNDVTVASCIKTQISGRSVHSKSCPAVVLWHKLAIPCKSNRVNRNDYMSMRQSFHNNCTLHYAHNKLYRLHEFFHFLPVSHQIDIRAAKFLENFICRENYIAHCLKIKLAAT